MGMCFTSRRLSVGMRLLRLLRFTSKCGKRQKLNYAELIARYKNIMYSTYSMYYTYKHAGLS